MSNPDVVRSGMNPLLHYLRFGAAEGRGLPAYKSAGEAEPRETVDGA